MTKVCVEKLVVTQDVMTNLRSMDRATWLSYEDWAKENGVAEFFYKKSIDWVLWVFFGVIGLITLFGGRWIFPDKFNVLLLVVVAVAHATSEMRIYFSRKWKRKYEQQTLGIQRALKKIGAKCYSEKYWLWESGDDQRLEDCLARMLPTDYLLLVVTEADAEGIDLGS